MFEVAKLIIWTFNANSQKLKVNTEGQMPNGVKNSARDHAIKQQQELKMENWKQNSDYKKGNVNWAEEKTVLFLKKEKSGAKIENNYGNSIWPQKYV